jgi:hypothetical protein
MQRTAVVLEAHLAIKASTLVSTDTPIESGRPAQRNPAGARSALLPGPLLGVILRISSAIEPGQPALVNGTIDGVSGLIYHVRILTPKRSLRPVPVRSRGSLGLLVQQPHGRLAGRSKWLRRHGWNADQRWPGGGDCRTVPPIFGRTTFGRWVRSERGWSSERLAGTARAHAARRRHPAPSLHAAGRSGDSYSRKVQQPVRT